ncbi:MAG: PLDc N-terminal domain-containing protein, partial [Duncaniella sp.]|nr:PLDc N-terminal domain-containing protein [Duncaniella sp.]
MTILLWTGIAAYILVVIAAVVAVVRQNRNPVKALAWITVLILFPAGGILLYLFVGQSLRNTRMLSRRKRRRLVMAESNEPSRGNLTRLSPENTRLVKLIDSLVGSHFYTGNSVEIFHRGQPMFDALFADLRQAVSYINIQYYIISDDALGQQLSDILVERAKAGVKVRLIYDYVGSFDTDRAYFDRMIKALSRIPISEPTSRRGRGEDGWGGGKKGGGG